MAYDTSIMTLFHFNILEEVERECLWPVECVSNNLFRYLLCSAHVFHGHSYIGKFTLTITR